jgi:hypothetical protein
MAAGSSGAPIGLDGSSSDSEEDQLVADLAGHARRHASRAALEEEEQARQEAVARSKAEKEKLLAEKRTVEAREGELRAREEAVARSKAEKEVQLTMKRAKEEEDRQREEAAARSKAEAEELRAAKRAKREEEEARDSRARTSSASSSLHDEGRSVFHFGKHLGSTFAFVRRADPSYVEWARRERAPAGQLALFVAYCHWADRSGKAQQAGTGQDNNNLNLNNANLNGLNNIPGVGEKLAKAIVDQQALNGDYVSYKDLSRRVAGIGAGKIEILSKYYARCEPRSGRHT